MIFFSRFDELFEIMAVDKEEKRSNDVAPVTCVYFKKSTLNDKWKTKLEKDYKKPVKQSKSEPNSDGEKANSVDVSGGKNIERVKRCTFFKKSTPPPCEPVDVRLGANSSRTRPMPGCTRSYSTNLRRLSTVLVKM